MLAQGTRCQRCQISKLILPAKPQRLPAHLSVQMAGSAGTACICTAASSTSGGSVEVKRTQWLDTSATDSGICSGKGSGRGGLSNHPRSSRCM